jgi:hypothetical protein
METVILGYSSAFSISGGSVILATAAYRGLIEAPTTLCRPDHYAASSIKSAPPT